MTEEKSEVDIFVDTLADAPGDSSPLTPLGKFASVKVDSVPVNNPDTKTKEVTEAVRERSESQTRTDLKMTPKQRLVEEAVVLFPEKTRRDLSRTRLTDLEAMIAEKKGVNKLVEDTAKVSLKSVEELKQMNPAQLKQEMGQQINANLQAVAAHQPVFLPAREELRAQTLYNFHRVVAGVLECVSETEAIQSRTGSNLAGLSAELRDNKEEFMEILKDLYREYHQEIDVYISPLTVYGVFMAEKLGAVFMENKKKISRGESVKSPLKLERILGLDSSQCSSSS